MMVSHPNVNIDPTKRSVHITQRKNIVDISDQQVTLDFAHVKVIMAQICMIEAQQAGLGVGTQQVPTPGTSVPAGGM